MLASTKQTQSLQSVCVCSMQKNACHLASDSSSARLLIKRNNDEQLRVSKRIGDINNVSNRTKRECFPSIIIDMRSSTSSRSPYLFIFTIVACPLQRQCRIRYHGFSFFNTCQPAKVQVHFIVNTLQYLIDTSIRHKREFRCRTFVRSLVSFAQIYGFNWYTIVIRNISIVLLRLNDTRAIRINNNVIIDSYRHISRAHSLHDPHMLGAQIAHFKHFAVVMIRKRWIWCLNQCGIRLCFVRELSCQAKYVLGASCMQQHWR